MPNIKIINQTTYNSIASQYESNYGNIPAATEYAEYICDRLTKVKKPIILDLGCGTGTLLQLFESRIPSSQLVGVDFSQELLNIAKNKLKNAKLVCQDFDKFVPDEKCDVIIATFSLIHSTDKELELMIPKIYSWLNESGYVYLSFILGNGEQILPEALDPSHSTYFNFHTQNYLQKLLVRNKFTILKQKIVHSQDEYENEDDIYFVVQK